VAALAAFADDRSPWVPFRWPALAAALIWPLASPLPPGTYTRLTLALQLRVSSGVVHALGALGIAAHREGNVIELARGTVGIEEACSGVRSLVACVFAGILFSAALTRRPWARITLIALSVPLALGMNFIRSLLLTLLVNAGVEVEGTWHDVTGYAVLVVTAALLAGLAILLDRSPPPAEEPRGAGTRAESLYPASQKILTGVLAGAVALVAFFVAESLSPVKPQGPAPDLQALLPTEAPGWEVITRKDLSLFAGTLRTDNMAERTYVRNAASGGVQTTIYVAYWPAGQASVGLVGTHTPDACWPGTGWIASAVSDPRVSLPVDGRTLAPAQHRLFVNKGYPQNVWFWQLYGGNPVEIGATRSVAAMIGIALRFGFRQGGDQMFVRVSSNRPWEEVSKEPFVASFLERIRPLGLY
jgi:exosortase/archaeosortase family protein